MKKLFSFSNKKLLIIYTAIDLLCIGMGMGVPVFPIIFGFVVGWFLSAKMNSEHLILSEQLNKVFVYSLLTSGITLIGMIMIWGQAIRFLFVENYDFAQFGHPMILYDPNASFTGWLFLMIIISPFLQVLTTFFGYHLHFVR